MKVGDSQYGGETRVGAAVRWELQEALRSGPLTEKNVRRMIQIVDRSLPMLQAIMGATPRKDLFEGVIAGRPTPLGVIPLHEFQEAWGGGFMEILGHGHARYLAALVRIAARRAHRSVTRGHEDEPTTDAKSLEPALRGMLERLLEGPYVPVTAKKIQRLLDAILRLVVALGHDVNRVVEDAPRGSLGALQSFMGSDVSELVGGGFAADESPGEPFPALAPSSPTETFGAKLVREILAMMPMVANAKNNTPENLVMAIVAAEREGMPELAKKLRKLLGVESADGAEVHLDENEPHVHSVELVASNTEES